MFVRLGFGLKRGHVLHTYVIWMTRNTGPLNMRTGLRIFPFSRAVASGCDQKAVVQIYGIKFSHGPEYEHDDLSTPDFLFRI